MSTTLQGMQPIVRGGSLVLKVEDVHLDMRLSLKGSCQKLGVDYAYLGPEGSQVTILVCKCKRTGCWAATQAPEKGMNVYALDSSLDGCAVWDGNDDLHHLLLRGNHHLQEVIRGLHHVEVQHIQEDESSLKKRCSPLIRWPFGTVRQRFSAPCSEPEADHFVGC